MRFVLIALSIVLLTASAEAQGMRGGKGNRQQQQTAEPKKKVDENAYKDALTRIPDQKPVDPWRNMR
jgi:hypothetical protein